MLLAAARRRVVAWRQPRSAARIARGLWVAWAIVVWNVVFDRVIVVAGREFIVAASARAAAASASRFVNMDDWMRPAVTRGFWSATAAGAAVLMTGLTAVNYAGRRSERSAEPLAPRRPPSTVPSATIERLAMPDKPR
jgi:CTP:molybdopterin cytidylyltransferase MocA